MSKFQVVFSKRLIFPSVDILHTQGRKYIQCKKTEENNQSYSHYPESLRSYLRVLLSRPFKKRQQDIESALCSNYSVYNISNFLQHILFYIFCINEIEHLLMSFNILPACNTVWQPFPATFTFQIKCNLYCVGPPRTSVFLDSKCKWFLLNHMSHSSVSEECLVDLIKKWKKSSYFGYIYLPQKMLPFINVNYILDNFLKK